MLRVLDRALFIRTGTSLQDRETALLFHGRICKAEGCDKFEHDKYVLLLQDLSRYIYKRVLKEIWMKCTIRRLVHLSDTD